MARQMNFQSIAWFWDLHNRNLLDMSPPYQRRSVWNQNYKDYFIDTLLLGYPSPAIFVFQEITPDGVSKYSVVDGKQRLSTIFEFARNEFPVYDESTISRYRNRYFRDLDDDVKADFWRYQFPVEYVPSSDEKLINNIFDRINRNVAKLTHQELRHARFSGEFLSETETLAQWMYEILPMNFPNIAKTSRKQMKDVEFVAELLLLLEDGPKSYSQDDLDDAFSNRDSSWERRESVVDAFKATVDTMLKLVKLKNGAITKTRLRNQADFYSLFGAIHELAQLGQRVALGTIVDRLLGFIDDLDDIDKRLENRQLNGYYTAVRSSVNDATPRRTRIDIIKAVILGKS